MERSPLVSIDRLLHLLALGPLTLAEVPYLEEATAHFASANTELANKASQAWTMLSERHDYLACIGTLLQHTLDPATKTLAYHSLRNHIDAQWSAIAPENQRELITHLVAATQQALQAKSQHPQIPKLLHALNTSLAAILKQDHAALLPQFIRQIEAEYFRQEPQITVNSLKVISILVVEAFNSQGTLLDHQSIDSLRQLLQGEMRTVMLVICHCLKSRIVVADCLEIATQLMRHISCDEYYNSPFTEMLMEMLKERHLPQQLANCLVALFSIEDHQNYRDYHCKIIMKLINVLDRLLELDQLQCHSGKFEIHSASTVSTRKEKPHSSIYRQVFTNCLKALLNRYVGKMGSVRAMNGSESEELEVQSRSSSAIINFSEEVYLRLQQNYNIWLANLVYFLDQRVPIYLDVLEEEQAIVGMEVATNLLVLGPKIKAEPHSDTLQQLLELVIIRLAPPPSEYISHIQSRQLIIDSNQEETYSGLQPLSHAYHDAYSLLLRTILSEGHTRDLLRYTVTGLACSGPHHIGVQAINTTNRITWGVIAAHKAHPQHTEELQPKKLVRDMLGKLTHHSQPDSLEARSLAFNSHLLLVAYHPRYHTDSLHANLFHSLRVNETQAEFSILILTRIILSPYFTRYQGSYHLDDLQACMTRLHELESGPDFNEQLLDFYPAFYKLLLTYRNEEVSQQKQQLPKLVGLINPLIMAQIQSFEHFSQNNRSHDSREFTKCINFFEKLTRISALLIDGTDSNQQSAMVSRSHMSVLMKSLQMFEFKFQVCDDLLRQSCQHDKFFDLHSVFVECFTSLVLQLTQLHRKHSAVKIDPIFVVRSMGNVVEKFKANPNYKSADLLRTLPHYYSWVDVNLPDELSQVVNTTLFQVLKSLESFGDKMNEQIREQKRNYLCEVVPKYLQILNSFSVEQICLLFVNLHSQCFMAGQCESYLKLWSETLKKMEENISSQPKHPLINCLMTLLLSCFQLFFFELNHNSDSQLLLTRLFWQHIRLSQFLPHQLHANHHNEDTLFLCLRRHVFDHISPCESQQEEHSNRLKEIFTIKNFQHFSQKVSEYVGIVAQHTLHKSASYAHLPHPNY